MAETSIVTIIRGSMIRSSILFGLTYALFEAIITTQKKKLLLELNHCTSIYLYSSSLHSQNSIVSYSA